MFRKTIKARETMELCEILVRDEFNSPKVAYMPKPSWHTYDTANIKVTIVTLRPIRVTGAGRNVVVNERTLDIIKALSLCKGM